MKKKLLKISVVTVVLNRVDTIGQTLASVQSQGYKNIEHIIVDGDSNDGTLNVINSFLSLNVLLISEKDKGIYYALNKGFLNSSGDVFGVLHADDFFSSVEVLQKVIDAFEDPEVDVVYGDLDYVSSTNPNKVIRRWKAGDFNESNLKFGWMPPHPALFIRKSVIDNIGVFDTKYRISSDYDFIRRCFAIHNIKPVYLPITLVKMRLGGVSNKSISNILKKSKEDFQIIQKANKSLMKSLITLFFKNFRKLKQFY
jgi:glycosyltransferase involved in cell wall biosynthesis